jgi:hypothetical protein
MAYLYLYRELNGNNKPTGLYKISTTTKAQTSWVGHHSELIPYHNIEVLNARNAKKEIYEKIKKYKCKNRTIYWVSLSSTALDEVRQVMNDYSEYNNYSDKIVDGSDRSASPRSSDGDIVGYMVIFVIILLGIFSGIPRSIDGTSNNTDSPENENTVSVKYEGVVDASSLESKVANVRSEPDEQSSRIKVLKNGTKVVFLEISKGWVHIIFDDGSDGWIASNLIRDKKKKLN